MASAAFALQQALHQRLTADANLLALLDGPRVYDDVPVRSQFPYVTFGLTSERDWSTGSDEGSEHSITLHVWSRAKGRKETSAIMDAIHAALHDVVLTLTGFRLVNLRHEFTDARRDADGETYHGTSRFRAVTEAL